MSKRVAHGSVYCSPPRGRLPAPCIFRAAASSIQALLEALSDYQGPHLDELTDPETFAEDQYACELKSIS